MLCSSQYRAAYCVDVLCVTLLEGIYDQKRIENTLKGLLLLLLFLCVLSAPVTALCSIRSTWLVSLSSALSIEGDVDWPMMWKCPLLECMGPGSFSMGSRDDPSPPM